MFTTHLEDLAPVKTAELRRAVLSDLARGDGGRAVDEGEILLAAERAASSQGRTIVRAEDIAVTVIGIAAAPAPAASALGTPTLDAYGRDLTADAAAGKLREVVGREQELLTIVEVLCRTNKRNPVLLGPPGVGKTAIVESLAVRLAQGRVPTPLAGARLIALHPSSLIAGVDAAGDLQTRVQEMIAEASRPDVILFIDEVHALVGLGGNAGTNDLANMLKPALARGDVACIAATTDEEYRRFIESDGALERRFQPIRVNELGPEATLELLKLRRDEFSAKRGIEVGDDVLRHLMDFAERYMRSRHFPDKVLDLLEQCVAHAVASGETRVSAETADEVAVRMVGMPIRTEARVGRLREELLGRGLLSPEDVDALASQLDVNLRGLGVHPEQPSAIVLLLDRATGAFDVLGETIATALFGSRERVLCLDFGRLTEPQNITLLLGSPPSYVGYNERLPIHQLLQLPWCVLLLSKVDCADPHIRTILEQALQDGYFTDSAGQRVYLSDTVVVMTAAVDGLASADVPIREAAEALLGPTLVSLCDVVADRLPDEGAALGRFLESDVLSELATRFLARGLRITWDPSLLAWLDVEQRRTHGRGDLERLIDKRVSRRLIDHLPAPGTTAVVTVGWNGSDVVVVEAGQQGAQQS